MVHCSSSKSIRYAMVTPDPSPGFRHKRDDIIQLYMANLVRTLLSPSNYLLIDTSGHYSLKTVFNARATLKVYYAEGLLALQ